jgi:hypothetical protein
MEKYICDKESLRDTLDKYGVAIIPGVISGEECDAMVSGIWDFLEHITREWPTPINRSDTKTWREFYKLLPLHSMLLQRYGVGHAAVSWNIRQNPRIADIFAHLWNCNNRDLLVSFDGLSFHLPPETTGRGWFRNKPGFHTDQSYKTPEFKCVQSFITGMDIEEGDATFAFMEGSHRLHSEFKRRFGIKNGSDWHQLNETEQIFYNRVNECKVGYIKCTRGSMVFWDSRTIHCGIEPRHDRPHPKLRAVIYLCYLPRNLASEKELKKKIKAYEELRTTSHNPCKIRLFPKTPRTYGADKPVIAAISAPILTELGMRLAGYN